MMNGDMLLEEWLTEVRSLPLSAEKLASAQANENMLVFPASELQDRGVGARQVSEFLFKAYREYWRKAEVRGVAGWFYAWYDEMSGTLRCSMATVEDVNDLPFKCRLDVADAPEVIARAIVESEYVHGIPTNELISVPGWEEPEEDSSDDYCLTVFARQIGSS